MITETRILFLASILFAQVTWAESLPEHHDSFTANDLVAWVWERNPGVGELEAALSVAVERIDPAGSIDEPTFSYAFAPRTSGYESQGLNQNIQISQSIPWPGTLAARRTSAEHQAVVARRDIDVLRLDLAAVAQSAYAEWYYLQRSLAIHHRAHGLLAELRSVAEARYAAGRALQQEVLQAEVELAKLDRHLLELTRIQSSLLAQINAMLNRDPASPLPDVARLDLPTAIPLLNDIETSAVDAHPILERLDAELAARSADVTVAEKAFWPDLRFTAGYNSLWDDPDKRPVVGISINVPLYRSKRRSTLSSAQAEAQRIRWQRVNASVNLLSELAQAHAAVRESMDAVALYESSLLPLTQEYFVAARADYEGGTGSFLAVISAEQQQLETEEGLERSRADLLRHLADLERVSGSFLPSYSGVRP